MTEDRKPRTRTPYAMTPGEHTLYHRLAITATILLLAAILAAMLVLT